MGRCTGFPLRAEQRHHAEWDEKEKEKEQARRRDKPSDWRDPRRRAQAYLRDDASSKGKSRRSAKVGGGHNRRALKGPLRSAKPTKSLASAWCHNRTAPSGVAVLRRTTANQRLQLQGVVARQLCSTASLGNIGAQPFERARGAAPGGLFRWSGAMAAPAPRIALGPVRLTSESGTVTFRSFSAVRA